MSKKIAALIACSVVLCSLTFAQSRPKKGACPYAPAYVDLPKSSRQPKPPKDDAVWVGQMIVLMVVSDTGYPCSAKIVKGLDKDTDRRMLTTLKQWQFTPAKKDGRAVPVAIAIELEIWRKPNGELVLERPKDPVKLSGN